MHKTLLSNKHVFCSQIIILEAKLNLEISTSHIPFLLNKSQKKRKGKQIKTQKASVFTPGPSNEINQEAADI
jgi:hypothetical protein